jgi:hypothetical protein
VTDFWKSDTAAIVKAMKATGNRPGVVHQWAQKVFWWARENRGPEADAVLAWFPHWRIRPFYTAAELTPLWPMLAIAIGHTTRIPPVGKGTMRLANELKFAGLPYIMIDGREYFIVEQIHRWTEQPPTADELREIFNAGP